MEEKLLPFLQVPWFLMREEPYRQLSPLAWLLYALMRNRVSLSEANGWCDGECRVYIYFALEEAMKVLHCGRKAVAQYYQQLEELKLIRRERQGLGRPNRIYVFQPVENTVDNHAEKPVENERELEPVTSRSFLGTHLEVSSGHTSNTYSSKTETSNTELSKPERPAAQALPAAGEGLSEMALSAREAIRRGEERRDAYLRAQGKCP